MTDLVLSHDADWAHFERIAQVLERGLGGRWIDRLDGLDQRYWDLAVGEHTVTLHLEHYLGISISVPDDASDTTLAIVHLLDGEGLRQV